MQKKAFDPRAKVANPFVQAYVEKQTQKSRPVGEAQSFVNVLLICGMVINFFVLLLVGWSVSQHSKPGNHELSGDADNLPLADAVSRIQQLEATCATMQSNVEMHKNAYYKLEGDYENMKAAMARMQTGNENTRVDLSAYPMPPAALAALANGSHSAPAATRPQPQPVAANDDEAPSVPREPARVAAEPKVITQQYLMPRARGQ